MKLLQSGCSKSGDKEKLLALEAPNSHVQMSSNSIIARPKRKNQVSKLRKLAVHNLFNAIFSCTRPLPSPSPTKVPLLSYNQDSEIDGSNSSDSTQNHEFAEKAAKAADYEAEGDPLVKLEQDLQKIIDRLLMRCKKRAENFMAEIWCSSNAGNPVIWEERVEAIVHRLSNSLSTHNSINISTYRSIQA